jgi:hypothetical protein
VQPDNGDNGPDKPLAVVIAEWQASSVALRESMDELFESLEGNRHD